MLQRTNLPTGQRARSQQHTNQVSLVTDLELSLRSVSGSGLWVDRFFAAIFFGATYVYLVCQSWIDAKAVQEGLSTVNMRHIRVTLV